MQSQRKMIYIIRNNKRLIGSSMYIVYGNLKKICGTHAKIIQLNEWGCRDGMQLVYDGNKEIPLAILSRILAQSCVTPPYIIQGYA